MSLHPLHLIPDPAAAPAEASAFFVPVADRGAWIAGLQALGPGARAFVLPTAADDLRPGGAVLVPASPCAASALPWTPCAKAWGRVFLPAGSRLEPALTREEARQLFPWPLAFFHPVLGPVGFAEGDALALRDLLLPPPSVAGDPTLAREGAMPLPGLGRMALRTLPTVLELLKAGGEGIGEQPPSALDPLKDPKAPFKEKAREAWLRFKEGLRGEWWRLPKVRKVFLWTLLGLLAGLVLLWALWWIAKGQAAHHPPAAPRPVAPPASPPETGASPAANSGHASALPASAGGGFPWAQTLASVAGWVAAIIGVLAAVLLLLPLVRFVGNFFKKPSASRTVVLVGGGIAVVAVSGGVFLIPALIGGYFLRHRFFPKTQGAANLKTASPRPPDIQSAREREIERLLKLLEENPEEGLRYALPLGGGHAGRGVAAPSTRLSLRDLGFSLGGGGGGGPADVWEPRAEQQWKLQQKYREQANAAILEGNFERAAYIHAKLLGDWRAAASVLEQGGLWRKAAQVHEEKLHDLSNAARCLEKAGALEEAAERYAKVHQDEKAGDLWSKLGRQAEAEAAWRRAVSRARTALDKARLLFEKLGDHDAAFGVLEAAWPGSSEAEPCLRKQWEYLRRLGRDDERLVLVKRLGREELARLRPAARMLATLAHWRDDEGDGTLADALEDLSWTIAGETLAAAPARAEAREVLGLVPGLAEKDKTLAEDARRFLARGTEAPAPLPRAKGAMVLREKGVRGSFKTPATWDDAAVVDGQWICQGRKQAGGDMTYALFVRGVKEPGDARAFSIYPWAILPGAHIVHGIQWGPRGRHAVVSKAVFSAFAAGGWPKVGSGDGFLRPACLAEALAVALQPDSEILFALVPAASGVVEAQVWAQGRLVASHALALGEWPLDWRYPACARDGAFYFAVGPLLVRCRIKEGFDFDRDVVDFGEPIVGLAAAPSPFPHRLLVVAGPRAVLVEPEQALAMQDIYRDPRGNALVGAVFTKDGHAVPVGTQGSVFVRAGEAVEPAGRMEVGFPDGTRFAALAPLDDPAGFTYLTEDGQFGAIRPG